MAANGAEGKEEKEEKGYTAELARRHDTSIPAICKLSVILNSLSTCCFLLIFYAQRIRFTRKGAIPSYVSNLLPNR